jgi:hypothetical protein
VATPVRRRRIFPGAHGDILVDISSAPDAAPRPAVILLHPPRGLEERLARAGFTAVLVHDGDTASSSLESVAAALDRGELGVARPTTIGIVALGSSAGAALRATAGPSRIGALVTGARTGASEDESAAMRVTVPWLDGPDAGNEDETVRWLIRHLP